MDKEKLNTIITNIKEKAGEEVYATFSDDIGNLITENENALNHQSELEKNAEDLETRNKALVSANSSLLQQVGTPDTQTSNTTDEETENKEFDFNSIFDTNGKILRD